LISRYYKAVVVHRRTRYCSDVNDPYGCLHLTKLHQPLPTGSRVLVRCCSCFLQKISQERFTLIDLSFLYKWQPFTSAVLPFAFEHTFSHSLSYLSTRERKRRAKARKRERHGVSEEDCSKRLQRHMALGPCVAFGKAPYPATMHEEGQTRYRDQSPIDIRHLSGVF
jgi:hypothetical protein